MILRLAPAALGLGIVVTAIVFVLDPGIDLRVADLFYAGQNRFVGDVPLGRHIRAVVYWGPAAALGICVLATLARRVGWSRGWAPTGRAVAMLALSLALGPGLLVNTVLKDHSHRPRPYQTLAFGGEQAFRPIYEWNGDCGRNCSFVSGEGSAAFWTLAPALLTPPAFRLLAVGVSLIFGTGVGVLRMAFGGHYLSDTIFAALFTWTVIWACWAVVLGRRRAWLPPAVAATARAQSAP